MMLIGGCIKEKALFFLSPITAVEVKAFRISYYLIAVHKSSKKLYGLLSIFYNVSSLACDSFLQSKVDL